MDHYSASSIGHKVIGLSPSLSLCASSSFNLSHLSTKELPRCFGSLITVPTTPFVFCLPSPHTGDSFHTFIVQIAQR